VDSEGSRKAAAGTGFLPLHHHSLIMAISRYDVLKIFIISKERGTAVGLRLRGRENLLITTLVEIKGQTPEDTVVIVNSQSIYGEHIAKTCYELSEIDSLFTLRILFDDPFYVYLRSLRHNIRHIREEVGLEKATVIR
jgi:hypothetical protein